MDDEFPIIFPGPISGTQTTQSKMIDCSGSGRCRNIELGPLIYLYCGVLNYFILLESLLNDVDLCYGNFIHV